MFIGISPMEIFSISCKNVPDVFFKNKDVAKNHFRRFGQIKKMIFKPKRRVCTVDYSTLEAMQKAIDLGCMYDNQIFEITREPMAKERKKRTLKNDDPEWLPDPEVLEELNALGGGPSSGLKKYNLRPEQMETDLNYQQIQVEQQKIRKQRTPPPHKKTILSEEQQELIELIKRPAFSIDEKYKVLDARDKLMRFFLKKKHTKECATKGTCRDMCPEKERLLRVIQHQVSIFEQDNLKMMDPRLAVKQYSRSSADQEAPLPHELRPVDVLQMTMAYLVNRIMTLGDADVNFGDWFHFLWDRTRSIRKDITQQELCSKGSVELVEQCARFHIHCSARLVAEEPSVFDQKINTENLTKCLQTLKYMYHDLRLKGEECANEAEFRGYVILLNLNDTNFMWEVQSLESKIQKSKHVQDAIRIYSALDKNNFVKFFKLVESTTYLNACILMRYFIQIRLRALEILLKCYTPRMTEVVYPLDELTRILGFESDSHAVEFVQNCGLTMNHSNTGVILNKKLFTTPDFNFTSLDRAMNLVESKRKDFTIAQIICGGNSKVEFENYTPQDSFSSGGILKLDSCGNLGELIRSNASKGNLEKLGTVAARKVPELPFRTKEATLKTATKTRSSGSVFSWKKPVISESQKVNPSAKKTEEIEERVVKNRSNGSIFGACTNSNFDHSKKSSFSGSIFGGVTNTVDFNMKAPESFNDKPANFNDIKWDLDSPEKKEIQEIFFKPKSPQIEPKEITFPNFSFQQQPFGKPTPTPTPAEIPELEIRQLEEENRKRKVEEEKQLQQLQVEERERLRRLEIELALRIEREEEEVIELKRLEREKSNEIRTAVSGLLSEILDEIDIEIRYKNVEKLQMKVRNRILQGFLRKWKFNSCKLRKKRKAIECSPGLLDSSPKERAGELRTRSQDLTLSLIKRYKLGKPLSFTQPNWGVVERINFKDLSAIVAKKYSELGRPFFKDVYWKCVVSLPDFQEMPEGRSRIESGLESFLCWRNDRILEQFLLNRIQSIKYCVEKQVGMAVKNYDANGFVFIGKDYNDLLSRRIVENLKNFGILTKIPIVLILQENVREDSANFDALIEQGIISNYHILLVDNFNAKELVENTAKAIKFLLENIQLPPLIEMDTMKSFLARNLCTEIWNKAYSFSKWNSMYKKCLQDPNVVVGLYNDALKKIKSLILNRACYEFATFPQVFKEFLPSDIPDSLPCDYKYFPEFIKDKPYFHRLSNILESFKLDRIEWLPPNNQIALEDTLFEYCKRTFNEPDAAFYRTLAVFLRKFEETQSFETVIWTEIIEIMSLEKIKQTNFSLTMEMHSIFNQLVVVYDPEALKEYTSTDWFYVNHPIIREHMNRISNYYHDGPSINEKREFQHVEITEGEVEQVITKARRKIDSLSTDEMKRRINEFKTLLSDLEESFVINRKITANFNDILTSVVEDN